MKFESLEQLQVVIQALQRLDDIELTENELQLIRAVFGRIIYPRDLLKELIWRYQDLTGQYCFFYGYTDYYLGLCSVSDTNSDYFNQLLSLDKRLELFNETDVIRLLIYHGHVKLYNEAILQVRFQTFTTR